MQTYLKTRPVWVQFFLFLGMAVASFFIGSAVGVLILSKITGIGLGQLRDPKAWDLANPAMLTFVRGMILIQFLFLFALPSLLFSYLSDKKPFHYLGLQAPGTNHYWLWAVLLIVVSYPFVEYVGYINQKIAVSAGGQSWMKSMEEEAARQIKFMLRERTPAELIKNLVFISLFAGIGEELFFRGILQRMLIRATQSPWVGIVLAAAIFSAFHFQFYGFLPRLFLGVLLGAIYWFSGSLWVAMLAHFLYDASVIVYLYFNPQDLQNADAELIKGQEVQLLVGAMISLALTFVLLHQMQKKSVVSYEAVYNDDFPKHKDDFSF
ncbi:CPBP family intramembrane glutamic endopeptidase [Flavisolibacter ginsenosidimutans]|uniref:CPBP family intramembrane metalloprotease n=1 Tax=Flavisolibacter ginsenosidimutans TaxID=661481 RepID=A0A5B8ULN4_9BACT|nr:CPBP family intramembrane glutamic endopeptidase [Flavisolibacter ginsenosidimutans]QEC57577.1 CPBP family intramembrane metalloprotease [Flavisolibacter ginsenosidimutans]